MRTWPEWGLGVAQEQLHCTPAWLGLMCTGQGSCGPRREAFTVTCAWPLEDTAHNYSTCTPTQALTHTCTHQTVTSWLTLHGVSHLSLTTILGAKELFISPTSRQ